MSPRVAETVKRAVKKYPGISAARLAQMIWPRLWDRPVPKLQGHAIRLAHGLIGKT